MKDPYTSGMFKVNPYAQKSPVSGSLCVVLRGEIPKRGLKLIAQPSRCLNLGQVHELILTDEVASADGIVDNIAYLGFFTVSTPGVIVAGDEVMLGAKSIGTLLGFDETHMPNHQNIVIKVSKLASGETAGAKLGDTIEFRTV